MPRAFTEEDREKPVYTSEGRQVGTVRDVEDERATVDRSDDDEGLTEEIKDMLGWNDEDDSHELRREHVDRYEDNRLYLRPRR
jgi:hypothetical protein